MGIPYLSVLLALGLVVVGVGSTSADDHRDAMCERQVASVTDVVTDIEDHHADVCTVAGLEVGQADAGFAQDVVASVSLNDVAAVVASLSDATHQVSDDWIPGLERPVEANQVYERFLAAVGHTVATATTANGADAPASGLVDRWFDAITDDHHAVNGAALSLVIRQGGRVASFDPSFLTGLANRIYDWEMSRSDPWTGMLMRSSVIASPTSDRDSSDKNAWAFSVRSTWDGLANVLAATVNAPQAASRFLAEGGLTDVAGEQVNERLAYCWQRAWTADQGEGFGVALRAAANNNEQVAGTGNSGPLVSQSVFMVSRQADIGGADTDGSSQWHIPVRMTGDVGQVMSAVWQNLVASDQDLAATINELGFAVDPGGAETVLAAAVAGSGVTTEALMRRARIDGHAPTSIEELNNSDFGAVAADSTQEVGTLLATVRNALRAGVDRAGKQQVSTLDDDIKAGIYHEYADALVRAGIVGPATRGIPAGALKDDGTGFKREVWSDKVTAPYSSDPDYNRLADEEFDRWASENIFNSTYADAVMNSYSTKHE